MSETIFFKKGGSRFIAFNDGERTVARLRSDICGVTFKDDAIFIHQVSGGLMAVIKGDAELISQLYAPLLSDEISHINCLDTFRGIEKKEPAIRSISINYPKYKNL